MPAAPDSISRLDRDTEVLILGAGPAGLSLGVELNRRAVPFLILERGECAESWRRMPRNMKLASPWKCNSLPDTPRSLHRSNYEMSRAEYLHYLVSYAEQANLPIRTGTHVQEVIKQADGSFLVRTSEGDYSSRAVANATGYFSNPFVPEIPGAAGSNIPRLHVADYGDPDRIAALLGKKDGLILMVGKRLSAGQIMVELANAGFRIALSHRSPIEYGTGPIGWWFLFRIFPWLEWLKLRMKGDGAAPNDVRMQGGRARALIDQGKVDMFPEIVRVEQDHVVFADGRELQPDLVLFATGFRPASGHLANLGTNLHSNLHDLESSVVRGLYFLGVDQGRNFQSRFIRGIRNDAAFLADRLQRKLKVAAHHE